jgi:hypothetical protein
METLPWLLPAVWALSQLEPPDRLLQLHELHDLPMRITIMAKTAAAAAAAMMMTMIPTIPKGTKWTRYFLPLQTPTSPHESLQLPETKWPPALPALQRSASEGTFDMPNLHYPSLVLTNSCASRIVLRVAAVCTDAAESDQEFRDNLTEAVPRNDRAELHVSNMRLRLQRILGQQNARPDSGQMFRELVLYFDAVYDILRRFSDNLSNAEDNQLISFLMQSLEQLVRDVQDPTVAGGSTYASESTYLTPFRRLMSGEAGPRRILAVLTNLLTNYPGRLRDQAEWLRRIIATFDVYRSRL